MGMQRPRHNIGRVDWIGSEAVGMPGQRTFRLMLRTDTVSAQMWLEKEQLQALSEAIARMLVEIDSEAGNDFRGMPGQVGNNPRPTDFPEHPDIEFQIGELRLRYDPQRDLIALEALDRLNDEGDPVMLRCLATRKQMEALQENSLDVISAGRPKCPLCGTPLSSAGMPHFCPPTNGHQKLVPDDED